MNRLRKIIGWLAFVVLAVANLACGGWLLRDVWLVPIARAEAVSALRGALGADVRIGAISGTLLRDVTIEGISVGLAGSTGAQLTIADARLSVGFELRRLIDGDLSGVRGLTAHAKSVILRLPPAGPDSSAAAEPIAWPDKASLRTWLALLPDGGSIDIDHFELWPTADRPVLAGPLHIEVSPRPLRSIVLTAEGVAGRALLTDDGLVHLDADCTTATELAARFGVDVPLEGGRLSAEIDADLEDRDVRLRLGWNGGRVRDRGPATLNADLHLRGQALLASVDADGPGASIELRDLDVPIANLTDIVRSGSGSAVVVIRDLDPWRSLLPERVVEQLPIRGRVRVSLQNAVLAVGSGFLSGRTLSLELEGGRLPLDEVRTSPRGASIAARVTATEPYELPISGGAIRVQGSVRGVVSGSLDAPAARGRVELRAGSAFDQAWETLEADVAFEAGGIEVSELDASGVRALGADAAASADLRGRVGVFLPSSERATVRLELDVAADGATSSWISDLAPSIDPTGRLHGARIAVAGAVEFGDRAFPDGSVTIDVAEFRIADVASNSTATIVASAVTTVDTTQTLEVLVDATLDPRIASLWEVDPAVAAVREPFTLHVHGSASLVDDELGPATVEVLVGGLRSGAMEPIVIDALAERRQDGSVDVRRLDIGGPLVAHATGRLPTLDPRGALAVELEVHLVDSAALSAFVPDLPTGASLDLIVRGQGTIDAPRGTIGVDLHHPSAATALGSWWPAALGTAPTSALDLRVAATLVDGGVRFDTLDARVGDPPTPTDDRSAPIAADTGLDDATGIRLVGAGTMPMCWTDGRLVACEGSLDGIVDARLTLPEFGPVTARLHFGWDAEALSARQIRALVADSGVVGSISIREPMRVLDGVPLADLALSGSLRGESLRASQLLGAIALGGSIDAELELGGTIGEPAPAGTLRIDDARFKLAADVPIIEKVCGEIRATRERLRIERFSGAIGGGSFRIVRGSLQRADGAALSAGIDDAVIDIDFVAKDALLVRSSGRKLRADAELTCSGTLSAMAVTGRATITSARFIQRISLVPDLSTRGGTSAGTGIELFGIPPPFGERIRFDIAIETAPGHPIDIVTNVLNAPLTLALRLRGSGTAPYLEGAVAASSGSLRLPAVTLGVSQALVRFTADDPRHPEIRLSASTRRLGIDVTATAVGRVGQVEVLLTSSPPLSQQELVVLVSTGVLPSTLQEQGLTGRASMVGGYLAQEIFDFYFGSDSTEQGAGFADRFSFYSGREVSRNGVESLVIDFDVSGGFALEGERDVYEDYNMGVLYRVRF